MDWIDPTLGYPDSTLREGVEKVPTRYCAVTGVGAHKAIPEMKVVHDNMTPVDGRDWELFTEQLRGRIDGQEYVWGMFVLGLGFMHVMFRADDVRDLTAGEIEFWSGKKLEMVGSHTGKTSYSFSLPNV